METAFGVAKQNESVVELRHYAFIQTVISAPDHYRTRARFAFNLSSEYTHEIQFMCHGTTHIARIW